MALSAMIAVTYLPLFVTLVFRGMPGLWKSRHRFILCWLVSSTRPDRGFDIFYPTNPFGGVSISFPMNRHKGR